MPRTAGRIEPQASSPGSRAMRISLTGRTCQQTSAAAAGARHVSRCLFQPPPVPVWAPSPKVRHSFIIDRGTCCLFSGPTRSTPGRSGSYVHLVGKQAVTQNACRSPCGFDFALRDALVASCVVCARTTAPTNSLACTGTLRAAERTVARARSSVTVVARRQRSLLRTVSPQPTPVRPLVAYKRYWDWLEWGEGRGSDRGGAMPGERVLRTALAE